MSQHPTPIVVISSTISGNSAHETFHILEAGALSAIAKPENIFDLAYANERKNLINTLRGMAEIKVAKRRFKTTTSVESSNLKHINNISGPFELIALGVSVGGPQALKNILSKLPADFTLPIIIVQHMSLGFIKGYASWLNDNVDLVVKHATHLELLKKGVVYLAPDDYHVKIDRIKGELYIKLVSGGPVDGFCPSITVLLDSVAQICGEKAIGALLTGMGKDGAQGLLEMKKKGGWTFIQDKESAMVFGMAAVAESLGAVKDTVKLDDIADYLQELTGAKRSER